MYMLSLLRMCTEIVLGFGRLAHQASRFRLNRSLVQVSLIALQSIYSNTRATTIHLGD